MRTIYLDHNASTPIAQPVIDVMRPFLEGEFGNPSSGHWASMPAKGALENARDQVADFLGCESDEVVFSSGGTEANNMALKGVWFDRRRTGNHFITSAIEHDAIRAPLRFLERLGAKVTIVPVDRFGQVSPENVANAIRPETILISIMHANSETGAIQPIEKIAQIARENDVLFHTDAAQSVGKIACKVDDLGVDMLSFSAHKIYGPKGVGALFIRKSLKMEPHNHGGGHEGGRRAGTESALVVSGLGAACALADQRSYRRVGVLRDQFWALLSRTFGEKIVLNGPPDLRVPNTLNVSFVNRVGADILAALEGVAAATGSACHAGCVDMSPVLIAMRTPLHVGMGAVRFSLGHQNTLEEIEDVVSRLKTII
ncbi:MAG: cysteine desulfurase family protein [Alphaproteobacteria bacterium]